MTDDQTDDATVDDAADEVTETEPDTTIEATKPATKTAPPAQGKAPKIEGDFDPERAARLIERLRGESATEKAARAEAEKKSQDTLKAVAKALGLAEDDKPDPEKLTAQLEEARAQERQRRTELQVLRLAPNLGADADALLDSQAFSKVTAGLDPTSSTFSEDVEDAIRDHLTKYPRHKATAPKGDDETDVTEKKTPAPKKPDAGKSGADMNGAGGKPRQWTAAELAAATDHEIVAAQKAGLLDALMNG